MSELRSVWVYTYSSHCLPKWVLIYENYKTYNPYLKYMNPYKPPVDVSGMADRTMILICSSTFACSL